MKSVGDFRVAIAATQAETATYATSPEFRREWLGLSERSRNLLAEQIRTFGELLSPVTSSLAGWKVLDVGCGDGRWLRRFLDYDAAPGDVAGVDVSDVRFAIGRAKNPLVRLVRTDGLTLPFDDRSFDLVTQFVCFTRIPTASLRRHTAAEMIRVLKRGGYIYWWDQPRMDLAGEEQAKLDPLDYFDLPIRRVEAGPYPAPSSVLRPFRGRRLVRSLLDSLRQPPTHVAALIGPKP